MALIEQYLDPGNEQTSGGWETDYTEIDVWESQNLDLTDAGGDYLILYCQDSAGSGDNNKVQINGWTTAAANYIQIQGDPICAGDVDSSYYITHSAFGRKLQIVANYVRVDGIGIIADTSNDAIYYNGSGGMAGSDIRITRCVIEGGNQPLLLTNACTGIIQNNIIYGHNNIRPGFSFGYNKQYDLEIYNNTLIGSSNTNSGIVISPATGSTVAVKNNLVQDYYEDYNPPTGGWDDTASNISSDSSSPDGASYQNISIGFVDAANDDYHLASTDTDAIGAGIGPESDANVPTTDIDGDTRSGETCDIGADEYVATATFKPFWALNATRISL